MIKKLFPLIMIAIFAITACGPQATPAATTATATSTVPPTSTLTSTPEPPTKTASPIPSKTVTITPDIANRGFGYNGQVMYILDERDEMFIVSMKRFTQKISTDGRVIKNGNSFTNTPTGIKAIFYWSEKAGEFYGWKGVEGVLQAVLINPPSSHDQPPTISVCIEESECNGDFQSLKFGDNAAPKPLKGWASQLDRPAQSVINWWIKLAILNQVCFIPRMDFSEAVWCAYPSPTPTNTPITPTPTTARTNN